MAITVSLWVVPAVVTVISFVIAGLSLRNFDDGTMGALVFAPFAALFSFGAALVASLVSWLISFAMT